LSYSYNSNTFVLFEKFFICEAKLFVELTNIVDADNFQHKIISEN
jgi:hypothetical protein